MKNNIDLIFLAPDFLKKLREKLKTDAEDPQTAGLVKSLTRLEEREIHSLMLEREDTEGTGFDSGLLILGDLSIDRNSRRVKRGSEEIFLTPKEFDILYFLASNRGQVFTKEQIYQAVWDRDYLLDDSNIMAFIRKLRKKIEPSPDSPKYILTIWGIGYKFSDSF